MGGGVGRRRRFGTRGRRPRAAPQRAHVVNDSVTDFQTAARSQLPPPARIDRLVLVGHPVAHSLSPRFQNAALTAAGLDVRYEALDVSPHRLVHTVAAFGRGVAGNATVPHKEALAAQCAVRSPLAERAGAVNTFWYADDGVLVGDNTDVGGFDTAVRAVADVDRPHVVALVGAGGSAAAVLAAVAAWPDSRVRVWSRRAERAVALAAREPTVATAASSLTEALGGATLVVNATPLGLAADDPYPVPLDALPRHAAVYDLVYAPARTAWVRAVLRAGHPADDGLGMLVEQGALAFARWFGREPDRAAMWAALADVTARRAEP